MSTAPQWFRERVVDGITLLLAFGLPGSPPAEVAPLTTTGWIDVLWRKPIDWDEELDGKRLAAAFLSLAGDAQRWPAPVQLLAHLPDRPERMQAALPAPVPQLSPQRRAELAAMRRRLSDHICATHGPRGSGVGVRSGDGTFHAAGSDDPGQAAKEPAPGTVGMTL